MRFFNFSKTREGESAEKPLISGTDAPIPDFPKVNMSDSFFASIVNLIPACQWKTDREHPEGFRGGKVLTYQKVSESRNHQEVKSQYLFTQWLKAVKIDYPESCKDEWSWLASAWVLFIEYANLVWDSPISGTDYRKGLMWGMVDLFRHGFREVKGFSDSSLISFTVDETELTSPCGHESITLTMSEILKLFPGEHKPKDDVEDNLSTIIPANEETVIDYVSSAVSWKKPADRVCYVCGGSNLWESAAGNIICETCHPPPCEEKVLRRIPVITGKDQPSG